MSDGGPRTATEAKAAAEAFRRDFKAVREQVARVVVGHQAVVDGVLTCLFVGGHALLEGVPGIGKTLLVRTLAGALRLTFSRVQFTPDLMPADITGTTVLHESRDEAGRVERTFRFQPGPVFAQLLLADEINRATPKTQSALLEAMQERSVTVAGTTHALPRPFFVMATQNPIEQEGTYPLPEAQLDRFFFKLLVTPSSREELAEIAARTTGGSEAKAEAVLDADGLLRCQALVRQVEMAPHVTDYAVRLVLATHPKSRHEGAEARKDAERFSTPMVDQFVRLGASPRGVQALSLAAKCRALLDGRPAAAIEDVRAIALPALRHRLILNFEASAEGVSADGIVRNLLETLPVQAEDRPRAGGVGR
ncbi:MAG: AAA family ATPase [Phycisphaerae bacterium]|nr:AAA family ATPase [Phycisphaerae bacterium]